MQSIANKFLDSLQKHPDLLDDAKREFQECENIVDKVKYTLNLIRRVNKCPKDDLIMILPKNNRRSRDLRMKGNKKFQTKKPDKYKLHLFNALELYNESICWAENEGEDLSIGYANRSAIYFDLNEFEMCLDNIRLAKMHGYPERLMSKLVYREEQCLKGLENEGTADDEAKQNLNEQKLSRRALSFKSNPQIPFIAECLELKQSMRYGRHIVTNMELTPGQIICIEEPYTMTPIIEYTHQRCANCLKQNLLNLLPCPTCTTAMFCSEKCLEESIVHAFVCPISNYIKEYLRGNVLLVHLIVKAFSSFDSVGKLREFCQNSGQSDVTHFSFDNTASLSAEQKYHIVHSLSTDHDKVSFPEMFSVSAMVGHLQLQLVKHTKFKEILLTEEDRDLLIDLLFRLTQIYILNSNRIEQLEHDITIHSFGVGIYPFCSLLNHACSPNVGRFNFGNKLVYHVLRTIKAGNQLFDCYTTECHHYYVPKLKRQFTLKYYNYFECNCEGCVRDFPPTEKLPIACLPPANENKKMLELSFDFALKNVDKYSSYLTRFDRHYPCLELKEAQRCMRALLYFLFNDTDSTLKIKMNSREKNLSSTVNTSPFNQ